MTADSLVNRKQWVTTMMLLVLSIHDCNNFQNQYLRLALGPGGVSCQFCILEGGQNSWRSGVQSLGSCCLFMTKTQSTTHSQRCLLLGPGSAFSESHIGLYIFLVSHLCPPYLRNAIFITWKDSA